MEVISITKIIESAMKWGCKFQLNLTWVEGRVRWRDLRDKTNLNMISQFGSEVCIIHYSQKKHTKC